MTKTEASEMLKLTVQAQQKTPMYQKLHTTTKQDSHEIKLQVSEEELEMMLDNIGIPTEEEPESRKTLRSKVKDFLIKLRES